MRDFLLQIWRLFNSWFIPGTIMTPAELLVGSLVLILVFRFIKQFASGMLETSGGEK